MLEVRYLKLKAVSQGNMFVLTLLVHIICVNFPEIEAHVGPRRAVEHGKCVLRWTSKTDITTATGEPPMSGVLETISVISLSKLG